jgi:succinate dehydrogenase / fumarate reductase cytochrome b subunit
LAKSKGKVVNRLTGLYQSAMGKKVIVAVTGILMLGFLLGHVAGNLKVFLPPLADGTPDIDHYGHFLRTMGEPLVPHAFLLWVARTVLLVSLVLHVVCVMHLATENLSAREVDYEIRTFSKATPPARWMMYSGGYLLVFIVLHLLHFTFGAIGPSFEHGKIMSNLQASFSQVPWVAAYMISMAVVAMHLYHGAWSLFQTLGLDNPDRNRGIRRTSAVVAIGLAIAFASVPVAILVGAVKNSAPETQRDIQAGQFELLDGQSESVKEQP